ncbi:ABC transporter ATP-binding protein, partial [Ruminococcus bicirculans (ex Wegman et al. 2014)]
LESVGIEELAKKPCNKLSGGQKQRVAIARAIVNEPSVILADEPTGALDTKTSAEIMELFKSLNHEGKTIIIVTHDMNIAEQCDRVIEISDGHVVK